MEYCKLKIDKNGGRPYERLHHTQPWEIPRPWEGTGGRARVNSQCNLMEAIGDTTTYTEPWEIPEVWEGTGGRAWVNSRCNLRGAIGDTTKYTAMGDASGLEGNRRVRAQVSSQCNSKGDIGDSRIQSHARYPGPGREQ